MKKEKRVSPIKKGIHSFYIAFSTYSKIPMPQTDWTKENMQYALCFFPVIGAVIGALVLGWSWLSSMLAISEGLVTAVYVLIPVIVTGGIHLDGYLDTCDALSSYQSKERKLEILKDSHAGAFAIICGISYFIVQYGVWSSVNERTLTILPAIFVLSRAFSALAIVSFPCARGSGLLATFSDSAKKQLVRIVMIGIIIVTGITIVVVDVIVGVVCVCIVLLCFVYYYRMSMKQFGGITGDLAGYFLQIAEVMMALGMVITVGMLR